MGTITRLQILTSFLFTVVCLAERAVNSYDPDYGVYLGEFADLADSGLSGQLFLVNESCLQVLNFTFNPSQEAYFWIDSTDSPTKEGFKLPTFEFGVTPLGLYDNTERVVLHLPQRKRITEFKTVSIYTPEEKQSLASITIPSDVIVPKSQFLGKELSGVRYGVGSGPILVQDRRTIKIFAFTFDADKAPDGYFFVGRGGIVVHDAGVKVPIRGRDTFNEITPMNQRYRGGEDIILDLPKEYDINHIDWLSVYCYKFRVDFGHVFTGKVGDYIPPYVPPMKRDVARPGTWKPQALLGSPTRTTFILQLGPPGGKKGYQGISGLNPPEMVWYVNGYLAEIYLKRGFNYSFVLEGGSNHSFYLSDDQFGGIDKLASDERMQVKVLAPSKIQTPSEKLCLWETEENDPDRFETFAEFRKTLHLRCQNKEAKANILSFMPDKNTPNVIYGNTASEYNTGFKIHIVDEFPADIEDINEEPFESDAWVNRTNSSSSILANTFIIIALLTAWLNL